DETILVRGVVHFIKLLRIWYAIAAPLNRRMQLNSGDRQLAFGILLHMSDHMILVRVEGELLPARDRQKREHVAARERSDEGLLGIDIGGITEVKPGRGCPEPMA